MCDVDNSLRAALAQVSVEADETNAREACRSSAASIGRGRPGGRSSGSSRSASGAAGRSRGRGSVPVRLWVTHALAHGDGPETLGLEVLEHVGGQVDSAQFMDVVSDGKPVTTS